MATKGSRFKEKTVTLRITLPGSVLAEFDEMQKRTGIVRAPLFARALIHMMNLNSDGLNRAVVRLVKMESRNPELYRQRRPTTFKLPARLLEDFDAFMNANMAGRRQRTAWAACGILAIAQRDGVALWNSHLQWDYWEDAVGENFKAAIHRIYEQCGEIPPQIRLGDPVPHEASGFELAWQKAKAERSDDDEGDEWKQPAA